jgi:hypothetical protein
MVTDVVQETSPEASEIRMSDAVLEATPIYGPPVLGRLRKNQIATAEFAKAESILGVWESDGTSRRLIYAPSAPKASMRHRILSPA